MHKGKKIWNEEGKRSKDKRTEKRERKKLNGNT
jgi:hypothetical protein